MFHSLDYFIELHEIIFLKHSLIWHMSKEHFHWYQISKNMLLVGLAGFMAMLKSKGQVLFRCLKVVVEHVLPADVILVGDLLGLGIFVL